MSLQTLKSKKVCEVDGLDAEQFIHERINYTYTCTFGFSLKYIY